MRCSGDQCGAEVLLAGVFLQPGWWDLPRELMDAEGNRELMLTEPVNMENSFCQQQLEPQLWAVLLM